MAKTTHSHTHSNGCPLLGVLRPKDQSKITGSTGGTTTGSFPTAKNWKNGSTSETIYADTAKKTTIGSLDPQESCQCIGKVDGMYLVCYKVNGTSNYKCGFAAYSGGC